MGELDQVTYYIDGLKPSTRMEVAYQAPDTLEKATARAIQYDTAMFRNGRPFSNNNNNQSTKSSHSRCNQRNNSYTHYNNSNSNNYSNNNNDNN